MAFFGHIANFLTFAALVLQIFSMIGTTYDKPFLRDLYFAKVEVSSLVYIVGLWGYCQGTVSGGIQMCSVPKAAFSWTDALEAGASSVSGLGGLDLSSLDGLDRLFLASFILYWIAIGLTFLALLITSWSNFSRGPDFCASLMTFVAFAVQMVVFIILLVISIRIINTVKGLDAAASGILGPSMWMTLGAFAALLLSSLAYCCQCICGPDRYRSVPKF